MSTHRFARGVCICLSLSFCGMSCTAGDDNVAGIAASYVALAQSLGHHDPDLLISTPGAEHRAEALTLDQIVELAARLRAAVTAGQDAPGRRRFLGAQLAALERRARFLGGEPATIRDEAAALGLPVPVFDRSHAAAVREELSAHLSGDGPLVERLARDRRESAVTRSRLDASLREAIDRCREQTATHLGIPDGQIELRYVLDRPWLAFTTYEGGGLSRIELRRDAVLSGEELLTLACHEGYPGHHLQFLVWDGELHRQRGLVEFSIVPLFTPQAVMAERSAAAAALLAAPDATSSPVAAALESLMPLALAVAVEHVDGRMSEEQALAHLGSALLMPEPQAFLAFVRRYRAHAVAYVTPLEGLTWEAYAELLRSPDALIKGAAP